uniref:Integrase core domain containing protein n=1 Tax=Solanum tuberosum TaxID=4113 RepID=M1DPH7_SOLTU
MVNAQELEAQRQRLGLEAEAAARGVQQNDGNNQPRVVDANKGVDRLIPPQRQPIAPRGNFSSKSTSRKVSQTVIPFTDNFTVHRLSHVGKKVTDLLPSVRLRQVVQNVADITGRATCRRPHLKSTQPLVKVHGQYYGPWCTPRAVKPSVNIPCLCSSFDSVALLDDRLGDDILKARRHEDITQGKSEYPLVCHFIDACTELVFCFSGTMGPRRKNANKPGPVTASHSEGHDDSEASGSEDSLPQSEEGGSSSDNGENSGSQIDAAVGNQSADDSGVDNEEFRVQLAEMRTQIAKLVENPVQGNTPVMPESLMQMLNQAPSTQLLEDLWGEPPTSKSSKRKHKAGELDEETPTDPTREAKRQEKRARRASKREAQEKEALEHQQ